MSNIKISEMTEATSLGDSDLLTIVQGGINKKITKINAIGDILTALNNPTYTTDTGTSLNLTNTRVGRLKTTLKGDTEQTTYTGKNVFNNASLGNAYVSGATVSTIDTGVKVVSTNASSRLLFCNNSSAWCYKLCWTNFHGKGYLDNRRGCRRKNYIRVM